LTVSRSGSIAARVNNFETHDPGTRFDLDFDIPDHFLPEFPPPIYLTTRTDLGDVSQGKLAAINRTIDILGPACGLVACKPWPLQFTPAFARDGKALKRLKAPGVGQDEAVRNLRAYWSKLGFWPVGETGIYLLGMAQRSCLTCRKSDDRRCLQPYKHLRRIYCAGISPL
jgi:hypothetical protein